MEASRLLEEVNKEIARLQQARDLLAGGAEPARRRGRTPLNRAAGAAAVMKSPKKRRKLSQEGRQRIAEAVKRRWAEKRKSARQAKQTGEKAE